ncbi:hypothetical protein B0T10DRAFT_552982 [Thelonectria olida]|uniref:Phenazine biosynthesis protein n=1 Tax=Thelonectria olida TaxID=1576542 RepID=A0A9P8VT26_9HYPO|nr:hypothetical protein B0T10DRAFT_552982 [Thelonectria olida]
MELQFATLDVFTDTPLKGNPLAVVTVPPSLSSTLSQAQKQAIAKEFNLSETVFIHDVEEVDSTARRIDIFTPALELPFAGHPTIGTAVHLQPLGVKSLVVKAGHIRIESLGSNSVRVEIPHNVRLHSKRLTRLSNHRQDAPAELANAEVGALIFSIVKGMTFVLIELPSLELLATAQVGVMGTIPVDLLDEGWRVKWVARRYYFVRLGTEDSGGRLVHKIRTRMIRPDMEDPATGSAACALASYLSLHVLKEDDIHFEMIQGVEMGRESTILLDVHVKQDSDGTRKLESLHLGGTATPIMKGTIRIPST